MELHRPEHRRHPGELARRIAIGVLPKVDRLLEAIGFDVGGKLVERLAHHHREGVGELVGFPLALIAVYLIGSHARLHSRFWSGRRGVANTLRCPPSHYHDHLCQQDQAARSSLGRKQVRQKETPILLWRLPDTRK
jgi:hypothetical protein